MLYPVTLLCMLAVALGQRCANDVKEIACEDREGIFYTRNGGEEMRASNNAEIDVNSGEMFSMSICNFNNLRVSGSYDLDEPLIEDMIDDIGRGAKVKIVIENSANVFLTSGDFHIEDDDEEALIDDLIDGDIDNGVQINVVMRDSANILADGLSTVTIDEGALVGEFIEIDENSGTVDDFCLETTIFQSASIKGSDLVVDMDEDSALFEEVVDIEVGRNSYISVIIASSANIDATHVIMDDGHLIEEVLHVDEEDDDHENLRVNVQLRDSANIKAKSVKLFSTEMVDDCIEIDDEIENGLIDILFSKVGTIVAETVYIDECDLVTEAVDIDEVTNYRSKIKVTFERVANILASKSVFLDDTTLVDDLVQIDNDDDDSEIIVDAENIANINCVDISSHTVRLQDESYLVDSLVDIDSSSRKKVTLQDSANIHVLRANLLMSGDSDFIEDDSDIDRIINSGKVIESCLE